MPTTYRQASYARAYVMTFPASAKVAKIAALRTCIAMLATYTPRLP